MFKQKYVLEVKGNDERIYMFSCPPEAPLGEIHDALFTMKGVVMEHLNKRHEGENTEEKSIECSESKECCEKDKEEDGQV